MYTSNGVTRGWADPGCLPYLPGTGGMCENSDNISACLNNCGPDSRDPFDILHHVNNDAGLPEFAIWGSTSLVYRANRAWGTMYRRGQTAPHWFGLALCMLLMDQKDAWNHQPFFDYLDRYYVLEGEVRKRISETAGGSSSYGSCIWNGSSCEPGVQFTIPGTPALDIHGNAVSELYPRHWVISSEFVENMWVTYRSQYGCVWEYDNHLDVHSSDHYSCAGETLECGSVGQCNDYPNQQACEYDPCQLNCEWNGSCQDQ